MKNWQEWGNFFFFWRSHKEAATLMVIHAALLFEIWFLLWLIQIFWFWLIKDGLLDLKTTNVLILKLFLYFLVKNMARDYPFIFWWSHPERFIAGRAFDRWLLLFWWWTPLQRLNSVVIWCKMFSGLLSFPLLIK